MRYGSWRCGKRLTRSKGGWVVVGSANRNLAGCLRRRRLAFPTGKVARPLAVTDESQNAAYFLQPNWNGSIVHPPAHKQSRFQLARLAARATLPAREGKCALRAQDAHLYKSQFAEASLVEGPRGSCTSCPTSVTHLLRALPAKSQFVKAHGPFRHIK